jgi:predicted GNAT superfamily acetyltransferase
MDIEIRALTEPDELRQVEALQRAIWDAPDAVIYTHMLLSFARNGGHVLGALEGERVVGALISYLGVESIEADRPAMANLKLVSQRMAVLPGYRDGGLGYRLKVAQRQFALRQGIRLVTWTFDPLLARNAHLNIRKLGAVALAYWRDYYGSDDSPMVKAGSSDRLFVEWWVTHNRVEQRISGNRPPLTLGQYLDGNTVIINPTLLPDDGALPRPAEDILAPQNALALVEIPSDYEGLLAQNEGLARQWRTHARAVLENSLLAGYAITDFVSGAHEGRARSFYVLSRTDAGELRVNRYSRN